MKTRRHGDAATRGRVEADTESLPRTRDSLPPLPSPSPSLRVSASPRPPLHPSKRLGQNFLVNRGVVERIVAAVAPHGDETIVEIGPGQGALTSELVKQAGRVVAIEFDRQLVALLQE